MKYNHEGAIIATVANVVGHKAFTPLQFAIALGQPGSVGSGISTTEQSLAVRRMFALPGVGSVTESVRHILNACIGKCTADGRMQLQLAGDQYRVAVIDRHDFMVAAEAFFDGERMTAAEIADAFDEDNAPEFIFAVGLGAQPHVEDLEERLYGLCGMPNDCGTKFFGQLNGKYGIFNEAELRELVKPIRDKVAEAFADEMRKSVE